ncbi:MAG: sigma-70 family RNA polymerase sigma factor [Alphaproteobacteria bacterium]|nr:sigma-70 family RNA polymerase sigma factor [Alphaproteobacteria bacterium]MBU0794815.1 sigma-70 family RNA polymerase sigma factor [Alphaproteobacteria bacterium]MBU0876200.1 sigma-70 family RNA polymerase sigma factor [Alphaproteobacteria bacterium]MBU1768721.1 sigma-70 family RNA polymerase sigma factor [Alphaproteobacteria bacterium]
MKAPVEPNADLIAIVQPLIPALRRYARALLRDRDDADDLVQDVLERAMTRWYQRHKVGSVRAWLFAILHNLAIDQLRRRMRHGASDPIENVPEVALSIPPDQEAAVRRGDILSLVSLLPEEQRSVLLLIGVEDLSYAEAAAVLDIPQGTVMSRLSRARERLRRMMDEAPGQSPALRIVK